MPCTGALIGAYGRFGYGHFRDGPDPGGRHCRSVDRVRHSRRHAGGGRRRRGGAAIECRGGSGRIGRARRGRGHRAAAFDLSRLPGGGSGSRSGRIASDPRRACASPAIWPAPCSRRAASSSSFWARLALCAQPAPTFRRACRRRRWSSTASIGGPGTQCIWERPSSTWAWASRREVLWAIVLVVPLLWVINTGVIAREERYLERKFGDAYRAYKARVRRWL